MATNHIERGQTQADPVQADPTEHAAMLPEWGESEVDDAAWVAALEASRRRQFAELADL